MAFLLEVNDIVVQPCACTLFPPTVDAGRGIQLRTCAGCARRRYAFPAGQWAKLPVEHRFASTIHCISSGVIELAQLSFSATVYRGFTGPIRASFPRLGGRAFLHHPTNPESHTR